MLTHSENVPLLCELALFYEKCEKLCLPLQTMLQDELGWLEKEIELWVWASVLTTPDGNINCLRLHLLTPRCCFFSFSFFSFACYIWVESSSSSATRRWIIGFSRTPFEVLILKFVNLKNLVCVCVCVCGCVSILRLRFPHTVSSLFSRGNKAIITGTSHKNK
jgi:hypothetical protein